jgi:hypothetical protein
VRLGKWDHRRIERFKRAWKCLNNLHGWQDKNGTACVKKYKCGFTKPISNMEAFTVRPRYTLTAIVYVVALAVGALAVGGQLGLIPFSGTPRQAQALTNDTNGSSLLLCDGCLYGTTGQVVTFTINFGQGYSNACCNTYSQPTNYQDPFWNNCDLYGCTSNQYSQPSYYQQPTYYYQQPQYDQYPNSWSIYPPASYNQSYNNNYWLNPAPTYNQYWNTYSSPTNGYWSVWP